MILDICDTAEVLEVLRIVEIVIQIIRIAVPLLLIFSISKSILHNVIDGEIVKELKKSTNKIIAAICIFLVPTFVNVVLMLVNNGEIYNNCVKNATPEGISIAYNRSATQAVLNARKTLSYSDYSKAINQINKLEDEATKAELLDELSVIEKYVSINKVLSELESKFDRTKYDNVLKEINLLSDSEEKQKLLDKYNSIYHYEKTDVVTLSNSLRYHQNGYTGIKYYLYSQCEGDWSNISLSKGTATFCGIGCGLTTCTVIISSSNSSVTPRDSVRFGDDYHHDEVIESQTNNNYDCIKYEENQITKEEIINNLEKGNVASIKVWGKSKGGSSKFTGSQHFMALIDYYDGEIFVGNAYGNYSYGKYGWYNADEVLTSIKSTVICTPKSSLIQNN